MKTRMHFLLIIAFVFTLPALHTVASRLVTDEPRLPGLTENRPGNTVYALDHKKCPSGMYFDKNQNRCVKKPAVKEADPILINCPAPGEIRISAAVPPGWTVFPFHDSMIHLDSIMVRNPGDTGISGTRGQMDCYYKWGFGSGQVGFTQMFTALPENHHCTKTETGARCVSR